MQSRQDFDPDAVMVEGARSFVKDLNKDSSNRSGLFALKLKPPPLPSSASNAVSLQKASQTPVIRGEVAGTNGRSHSNKDSGNANSPNSPLIKGMGGLVGMAASGPAPSSSSSSSSSSSNYARYGNGNVGDSSNSRNHNNSGNTSNNDSSTNMMNNEHEHMHTMYTDEHGHTHPTHLSPTQLKAKSAHLRERRLSQEHDHMEQVRKEMYAHQDMYHRNDNDNNNNNNNKDIDKDNRNDNNKGLQEQETRTKTQMPLQEAQGTTFQKFWNDSNDGNGEITGSASDVKDVGNTSGANNTNNTNRRGSGNHDYGDSQPQPHTHSQLSCTSARQQRFRRPVAPREIDMTAKVLVIGNSKCGKSSIIARYARDTFDPDYKTTIGADYVRKDVRVVLETGGEDARGSGESLEQDIKEGNKEGNKEVGVRVQVSLEELVI